MLEHVVALGTILGHHTGAMSVVDNVVLDEPIVAVMDGNTPLRRPVDRVSDQRKLVTAGRRLFGSEVVMEVNRVSADLVDAESFDLSLIVEFRVIEHAHLRAPHVEHLDETQIDVGAGHENHVAARAGGIFRTDNHVAADVSDVRQEFELVLRVARALMVVLERRAQSDLVFGDRRNLDFLVLRLVIASAFALT